MSPARGHYAPGSYERTCDVCPTTFRVRPSDVRKALQRGHEPRRFCSPACQHSTYVGAGNPKWRGGTYLDDDGYVYQHAPDHPHANHQGYVMQHRLVLEQTLGRLLDPAEVVHHANHVHDDNRPENLELMASQSAHRTHHGYWQHTPCPECGTAVRRSAGQRRRGIRRYCSRTCSALVGSRAAAAAQLIRSAAG